MKRLIAIHYPAEWGKEDFIKDLCEFQFCILAPYIDTSNINPIPNVDNFVILKDENISLTENLVPIKKSDKKEENCLTIKDFKAKDIIDAIKRESYLLKEEYFLTNESKILKSLEEVSIALTSERDHRKLLSLILEKARKLSQADAGSLYLIQKEKDGSKKLRFVLTQNDSVDFKFEEREIPLTEKSIASYVALKGEILKIEDVYELPSDSPYTHNKKFDEESGYRAKSMLVLPMINSQGEIIGVIQLINRKKVFSQKITKENIESLVTEFDARVVNLMRAFSSMAAVAIENNELLKNIERLFEGMVEASVKAVEQRDPATSGHSERVCILTLSLAEAINKTKEGRFKDVYFSEKDLKQLRYAAMLHDFGKIGVRENVLTKSKKLYDHQLEVILARLEVAKFSRENELLKELVKILQESKNRNMIEEIRKKIEHEKIFLDEIENLIKKVNEPTILPEGDFQFFNQIKDLTFKDTKGNEKRLLEEKEIKVLSLPKGTLTEEERREIESHVIHTFEFLQKIPWTEDLKDVPTIALFHHEKLNGKGYPKGLKNEAIPLPSRLMAVADIFDALSAADRPYKKALSIERTLDILIDEAKKGELDYDVVKLFIETKVYEKTLNLRKVKNQNG